MKNNIVKVIIGAITGAFAGSVIGLIIGMDLGGNYFKDFVFNGVRGYEAVGQIGSIIGAVGRIIIALTITIRKRWALKI